MLKFALMKVEKSGAWNDSILSIAFKQVHLPKNLPIGLFPELKNQPRFVYQYSAPIDHRFLKALVAFELKVGPFEPEYAGKMDFYLNLLNDTRSQLRHRRSLNGGRVRPPAPERRRT